MKLYKYSLIAALALTGALSACSDDNDYTPAAPVSGDEVYLPLSQSSDISIPSEATTITIDVCRVNDADALTVPVTSTVVDEKGTDVSSIFSVPSEVTFAAGEKAAGLQVAVDFSKVEAEVDYVITVSLDGDQTTPYGASTREYVLTYAPWTPWTPVPGETAIYTDNFFDPGDYEVPVYVSVSTIDENRTKYAICNMDWMFAGRAAGHSDVIDLEYTIDKTKTVKVDGVEYPMVTMTPVVTNYGHEQIDGVFIMYDVRSWLVDFAKFTTPEKVDAVMAANDFGQSYYNPETGTFHVNTMWVMSSWEGTTSMFNGQPAYDYLQLPGYKSYVINFDYTGNFVDPKGTEYAVVNAFKSDDVASFVADIFIGELDKSGVDAAIEDLKSNDDLESYTSSTNLAFICDEAGPYTVVGIGYDESGNEVCEASYTFNYETVKANSPWKSIGYCEYTDGFIISLFGIGGETWDVEVEENTETPGVYRLVNPYKDWAAGYDVYYPNGNYYMIVHAENPDQVYLEQTDLGVQLNQKGSIYAWSLADLRLQNGWPANAVAQAGNFGTLNDGVITFPTGALIMTYSSLVPEDGWYYANVDPNNPAFSDDEVEYDPTWGNGTFCINFGSAKSAPAKHKVFSHKSSSFKEFDVKRIKVQRQSKANDFKTALKDYRRGNIVQLPL